MSKQNIILCGMALLVLSGLRRRTTVRQTQRAALLDPTSWGADQWARLYGDDLAMAGGQNNAQSGLTAYGFTNAMGFQGSAAR
jgi:hypothetical protein